jgi:hypothetical protein
MSASLAYSYSTNLTIKEQTEIDEKTKKCREEFSKGFVRGVSFSLAAYFLYSLTTSAAYAAESNIPAKRPKTPVDTGAGPEVCPKPMPKSKPGFKPLSEGVKGTFVGGASAICAAAMQSGDFYLGLTFALMLVVGGIIINRHPD